MKHPVSLVTAALLLFAAAAQAHSHLEGSTPAEGSTVSASPPAVELHFSEAVRVTALSVQKGDEKKQPLAPLPDKPAEKITVSLPPLAPGAYVVNYRAVSDDNHVMSGVLHFTVGASQPMDHSKMNH